jgi:hypothetical protein
VGLEHFEAGAGSFFERIEPFCAFGSSQRLSVFVENDYLPFTDEKIPFAADAVIQSGFTPKHRALALRTDHKLMSKSPARGHRGNTTLFPQVHDRYQGNYQTNQNLRKIKA